MDRPWRYALMQNRIDMALIDSKYIESFGIEIGSHEEVPYDVINGLIGLLMMQDTHAGGFKSIRLLDFGEGVEELNQGLLDKLYDMS